MPNILIFSVVCLLSAYGTSLDQWNIIRSSSAPFKKMLEHKYFVSSPTKHFEE